ncbi:outer membrane protein assembly factor [Pararhizobium mangrovi]|uniref:Outer membrane protein assembly factor n=1 Tax=Pararhizobium mangrovi TaxID=2590452 RepID=A0A506TYU3_9HYPH|nr:outer membrane protein assembly factor [Pararhizobium mangrovi]
MTFFGKKNPNEDVIGEPIDYKVDIRTVPDERGLRSAVQGASDLYNDRKKPASGAAGLIAKARSDYKSILSALYARADYGPVIHIYIDGKEAAGLPPDTELASPAQVQVVVTAGPDFTFGDANVVNAAPPPTTYRDKVDSPKSAGFARGEPARSGVVLKANQLATNAWRQQGYPKAKIAEQTAVADHRTDRLNVNMRVDQGPHARYGLVSVEGTGRMKPGFVAKQTDLKPGEEYDPDDIKQANDRLTKLDVFKSLNIQEGDVGPNGIMPITVKVQERKLHRFGVGGTYSTLDGLGLNAFWLHRDLFGHAERLRVDGAVGGIGETSNPKDFDYSLGVTFTRPGIFDPDTDLNASLLGQRQVLDPYTETSVEARLGFTHTFTPELTGQIAGSVKRARFKDDYFGTRDFLTIGLPGELTYDSRDNELEPTQGFYIDGTAEPFYEIEYGNVGTRLTAEGRTYYGFGKNDRVVLAGRAKIGSLVGSPLDETPPDMLFFAGGGNSVRGYDYQGIGVRRGDDEIGGRSLFEGSLEVRTKITNSIGIVGFADAGTVGPDPYLDFSQPLRVGAGVGLRYFTGLGPIRLDVAVPLNPGPDDPDFGLYVGIGEAF